jgi:acetyl esterase/lipase
MPPASWILAPCLAAEQPMDKLVPSPVPLSDADLRSASTATDHGVRAVRDLAYVPGSKDCVGDLYLPPGYGRDSGAKYPVLMVVHGGAWMLGSKYDPGEVDVSNRFAQDGYVVYDINYRLVQAGGTWPNSMNDVMDSIAFLKTHADQWHLDFDRFGLFGGSAGSQMALLAAYAPPETAPFKPVHYPGVTIPKAKVVGCYGTVSDMSKMEYTWVIHYMDDTPWHSTDLYAQASPITYIKTAVPTFCAHGDHDNTVPIEQSKTLVKALKEAGIKTDFLIIKNSRHVFHEEPGPKRELAWTHLKEFVDSVLK